MKRILSVFTAFIIAMFSTFYAFAEENFIEEGDTVILLFKIAKSENIAGVRMTANYDDDYLKAVDFSCPVGGSVGNIENPPEILWNFIVYSGRSFNNEAVAEVTFKCVKKCRFEDIEVSYDCLEMFDPDIKPVTDDKNSMFEVILKSGDYERLIVNKADAVPEFDSDTDTGTDSKKTVSTVSQKDSDISHTQTAVTQNNNSSVNSTVVLSTKTSDSFQMTLNYVDTSDKHSIIYFAFITVLSMLVVIICRFTK